MKNNLRKVLIVDDDDALSRLIERAFKAIENLELYFESTVKDASLTLNNDSIDFIISDYKLPDGDGLELLKTAHVKNIPSLMMTSAGDEEVAVEAMKAGALDYIVKSPDMYKRLPDLVEKLYRGWVIKEEKGQLKEMLQENNRRYQLILDTSSDGFAVIDLSGKILDANRAYNNMLGYTQEEMLSMYLLDIEASENADEIVKHINLIKEKGSDRFESKHRCKTGNIKDVEVSINYFQADGGTLITFIKDITEKKRTEKEIEAYRIKLEELVKIRTEQLESQYLFLRKLIDTIPNPVFVKNREGIFTEVNKAFEEYYEIKREHVIDNNLHHFVHAEEAEISIKRDKELLKRHSQVVYENFHIKKNGEKRDLLIYKSSFGKPDCAPEGTAGMVIDITDQKRIEALNLAALAHEKELNEIKSNFISMASHESRTPLTSILASADLLEIYGRKWEVEKYMEHVKKIQRSVTKMTGLLDDVLTLSRNERGKFNVTLQKVNLKELLGAIISEQQTTHNIILNYKTAVNIFNLDQKLIEQIMNNLLSNAVKFSNAGSTIKLNCKKVKDELTLEVIDEGIGISESEISHVFDAFYRTGNAAYIQGSGLGLSIVKDAVDLLGGKIEVKSKINQGTKFTIKLHVEAN